MMQVKGWHSTCNTRSSLQMLARAKRWIQAGFSLGCILKTQLPYIMNATPTPVSWSLVKSGGVDGTGPFAPPSHRVGQLLWRLTDLEFWLRVAMISTQGQRAIVCQLRKAEGERSWRELGGVLRNPNVEFCPQTLLFRRLCLWMGLNPCSALSSSQFYGITRTPVVWSLAPK